MSINILIADDHQVVRTGLKTMLAGTEFNVIAEAIDGDEAVKLAAKHKPDLVLLDIRMPGIDGLAALSRIKMAQPNTPVLMLSTYDNPTYVAKAVALGASGYILKGASRDELIASFRKVAAGEDA